MCGLSQKYSGDVNQTKPNLISQISNLVQFGLTSPEYFCDNPHIVRHLPRDINHTIPASPEGFKPNYSHGFDPSGDVVLCVGYRRNTRETANQTEPNNFSMR